MVTGVKKLIIHELRLLASFALRTQIELPEF